MSQKPIKFFRNYVNGQLNNLQEKLDRDYNGENSTQEEVADVLGKDTADAMAAQSAKMEAQSKAILKDLQFDKINLEGVSTKNFEEAGGFKGIQDFAKSFQGVTKRPMLAKATQNLGDGSAKGVSGQLSSIKAITGGKGASGFLKKFTTQTFLTKKNKIR